MSVSCISSSLPSAGAIQLITGQDTRVCLGYLFHYLADKAYLQIVPVTLSHSFDLALYTRCGNKSILITPTVIRELSVNARSTKTQCFDLICTASGVEQMYCWIIPIALSVSYAPVDIDTKLHQFLIN